MESKLLKVKDIQEYFSCGKNRAYDIVNTEGFPKIKIGSRFYIPRQAFEKWVSDYTYKECHL